MEQLSYKPSAYYFREALREARTKAEVMEIALQCVRELEEHKAAMRARGIVPPRRFILSTEAEAKNLIPFPCGMPSASSERPDQPGELYYCPEA